MTPQDVCEQVLVARPNNPRRNLDLLIINGFDFLIGASLRPSLVFEEDEASWLVGINGGYGQVNPYQYAIYPPIQGNNYTKSAYSTWLTADGNSGRPLALARTQAAFNLLWGHFPYVYRALNLDSDALSSAGVMAGFASPYSDTSKYPVLSYPRPILPKQLQFFLKNPGAGTYVTNWLRDTYPIRLRLLNNTDWYEVPLAIHVRTSGNGMIWLDGIQTEMNGRRECIYEGDLFSDPCDANYISHTDGTLIKTRLKQMVINCAVPLDHRVEGTAAISGSSIFTDDYNSQLGGPPIMYIDSPNAFSETHQINSQPGAMTDFYGGTSDGDTITSPLNRLLPPGSEASFANYAAERKLFQNKLPERNGVFRLCGIRTDFRAGMWIGSIIMVNSANPDDANYLINAPIRTILHDFIAQQSVLGGITNASISNGGARGAAPVMR